MGRRGSAGGVARVTGGTASTRPSPLPLQTVSGYHLRVADGVGTLLQMQGMTARLTAIAKDSFMLAR
jgi:hypothetical protein